jgi:hypothetical protein
MSKIRWIVCPKCDCVQPLGKTWTDEAGYLMTECEFCEHNEVPYQIEVTGFEVDDVTDEEVTEYLRKTNE